MTFSKATKWHMWDSELKLPDSEVTRWASPSPSSLRTAATLTETGSGDAPSWKLTAALGGEAALVETSTGWHRGKVDQEGGSRQHSFKSGCRSKGGSCPLTKQEGVGRGAGGGGSTNPPPKAVLSAPAVSWSWNLERLMVPEHSAQESYQEVEKEQGRCQIHARVPCEALAQEQFGWSRIGAFPKQPEDSHVPIWLPLQPLSGTPGHCLGSESSLVNTERKLSVSGQSGLKSKWVGQEKLEATHSEVLNRHNHGQGEESQSRVQEPRVLLHCLCTFGKPQTSYRQILAPMI